jgi:uncharacterized membrane protein
MSPSRAVEHLVARVLLGGGLLSTILIAGGLALYLWQAWPPGTHPAPAPNDTVASPGGVRAGLSRWPPDPLALSTLGLVCLLATPVAGVALAAAAFWARGDGTYAAIAGIVLGMLLVSLAVAGGG